jgi:hypothetical protein
MHDIRYDAVNDEFLVANPFAQAILAFRGDAKGEERPIRVIQGPHTQLRAADRLDVDAAHHEIFVPEDDRILVYPRTGNGDVAPVRVIQGPDTQLKKATGVAVDPVHNLIIVSIGNVSGGTATRESMRDTKGGAVLIFDRTGNGNVKPQAVIHGAKTGLAIIGQIQVYPPKGWIVLANVGALGEAEPEGGFVGGWSIHDDGNVPPRWKIAGPKTLLKGPLGVVLDPKYTEIHIADMLTNGVLTYYFPDIF